jgi:MFS transporter, DHA2 family, multidrug resistance protein
MTRQRGEPVERAGKREWAGLALLALPCLLVSMDAHVLNLAVPALTADLRPTGPELLWIVDIYAFLVAGLLLTMGALADRVGRRRVLLAGAAGFGAASALAAASSSPSMLIAARALLGVAGATLMPCTLALIRAMFPDPRQRRTAFGVWTASFALGGVIAPVVAGLLLQAFWWGSVFLVAVPPMALLLAAGRALLPEVRDPGAAALDPAGVALSLVAVLCAVHGIKRAAQGGVDAEAAAAVAAGVLAGRAFLRRQKRRDGPMLDLALFRRRAFSVPLAVNALSFFVLYGTSVLVTQYLQLVLGLSALHAGLWTIPSALGYLAGSAFAPVAANRMRPAWLMGAGLSLCAVGFWLLTQAGPASGLPVVVTGTVVSSIGLAPVYVLATEMTVGAAPPERSGAAGGILETCAELGGALGIAVLGSLGSAVYRAGLAAAAPLGIPPDLWENARRTLGGAMAAAARLPDPSAAVVAGVAREAFTDAFRVVVLVGGGIMAALAVASVLVLRRAALGAAGAQAQPPRRDVRASARRPRPAAASREARP